MRTASDIEGTGRADPWALAVTAERMTHRPAVFLDRDGVLNAAADGSETPRTPADLRIHPDARRVVDRLRDAGFNTIIVTNQPDVARGLMTLETAAEINETVRVAVGADAAYLCPHSSEDQCRCRKPLPGMLLDAAEQHGIDLPRSWMVGDRWVDIAAARAAGVRSVLLERPYSWSPTSAGSPPTALEPAHYSDSLPQTADLIIGETST